MSDSVLRYLKDLTSPWGLDHLGGIFTTGSIALQKVQSKHRALWQAAYKPASLPNVNTQHSTAVRIKQLSTTDACLMRGCMATVKDIRLRLFLCEDRNAIPK